MVASQVLKLKQVPWRDFLGATLQVRSDGQWRPRKLSSASHATRADVVMALLGEVYKNTAIALRKGCLGWGGE